MEWPADNRVLKSNYFKGLRDLKSTLNPLKYVPIFSGLF